MIRWPPRPILTATFFKGHGLGNDYVVFPEGRDWPASPDNIRMVCDRHRGVGADGIVVLLGGGRDTGDGQADGRHVWLRMFNPDGGEFERSGNGLRVLGSYLSRLDPKLKSLQVTVGGDTVRMTLHGWEGSVHDVSIEMGRAETGPTCIGLDPEAISVDGSITGPLGEALRVVPVSVGNPHLVVIAEGASSDFSEVHMEGVGPFLAEHPALLHGANVQLVQPIGEGRCRAFIWERGVGRTSASGTSACAVAVALVSAGRLKPGDVTVQMPGGELVVSVTDEFDVVLRGPAKEVCEGNLTDLMVESMREGGRISTA